MQTFVIKPPIRKLSRTSRFKKIAIAAILNACLYFSFQFLANKIWPSPFNKSLSEMIFGSLAWGIIFTAIMSSVLPSTELLTSELNVSDEYVEIHISFVRRRIDKGKVRTIRENKRGLLISKHGKLGTYFWGGIWIPRSFAEYDNIKSLATKWHS